MTNDTKDVSKRGFIKVMAGSALGGAMVAQAGHANAAEPASGGWDDQVDVVVVGGGGAGLAAAIEAGRAGAKVVILEKTMGVGGDTFRNGGVMAGQGTRLTKAKGVDVTNERVQQHFASVAPVLGTANPEVAHIIAEKGGETIDWLESLGVRFTDDLVADPSYAADLRIFHQVVGGGRGYAVPMTNAAKAAGVNIMTQARVTGLVVDAGGRVVGVDIQHDGKAMRIKARKAVVLTSGGYGANAELLELFNPSMKNLGYVCSEESVGDGLLLALKVGAIAMRTSQGPLLVPDVEVEANNIFQWQTMQGGGIAVGEDGKRFVNEDSSYMTGELTTAIRNQISRQKAGNIWMIVNDSAYLKHALEVHPVALAKGDTIAALAKATGLDAAALKATVDTYNQACAAKNDAAFGRKLSLIPLDKGPFYAGKVRPGVVLTTGGIKTDGRARVIRHNGVGQAGEAHGPIPGLLAAGQVVEWSAVGGWTVSGAFTMGRVAGREAAALASV